jgi:hypothetical protein
MSEVERFISDPNALRQFQQERLILEVTELIHSVMEGSGVRRSELAKALGRSRGRITQILDGTENLTLRTVADAFTAMGKMLCVEAKDISIAEKTWELSIVEAPTPYYTVKEKPSRWIMPNIETEASEPLALAG